jgi:hypothetical protein
MKRALVGLLAIIFAVTTTACSGLGPNREGQVQMPASSSDYVGEHFEIAVEELEGAGFTNVQTKALGDLITGWLKDDGEVEKIRVDGGNSFSRGAWFPSDTRILITYHSFPEKLEVEQDEPAVAEVTPMPESTGEVAPPVRELVWAEVDRFQVSTAGSSEPFTVNGKVRVRYEIDFVKDSGYILGSLDLNAFNGELCRQSSRIESRRIGDYSDEPRIVEFREYEGLACINLHLTDPNWNKGIVDVIVEAQVPAQ